MIDVPAWLLDDAAAYDAARDAASARAAALLLAGDPTSASAALRAAWASDGFAREAAEGESHLTVLGSDIPSAVSP